MNEEFFLQLRESTYEDLWRETSRLEKSEASCEKNLKICLLKMQAEFYQLINKLKRLQIETPDFMQQYDLICFFGSDDLKENNKKIVLLKRRLTSLLKSSRELIVNQQARKEN